MKPWLTLHQRQSCNSRTVALRATFTDGAIIEDNQVQALVLCRLQIVMFACSLCTLSDVLCWRHGGERDMQGEDELNEARQCATCKCLYFSGLGARLVH